MNLRLIITLVIFAFTKVAISQNSGIKGRVIDEKTGETLPGATVVIEGTTAGGNTDLDGRFSIGNVAPGTYRLVCRLISYTTKIIEGVIVKSGEPSLVTISIGAASTDLGVVEVRVSMNRESSNSLLIMQKNSATVSDGVSYEAIKRTPDRNTGDVLKRVSGASIQDNKFAIIRGLNDRYNAAYLNGAPLPSSESDRKAFAFDIFPSNMLDNLVIVKTATPDLPAEFAGGIIQINTKDIPDKNFQSLSIGAGYNTITTGRNQVYYEGGKTDWLGLDDGTRAMPDAIPSKDDFPVKMDEQAALAKESSSDWRLLNKNFSPNYNFQYSAGYTLPVRQKPLGLIVALTYNKTNNFNETIRRGYTGNGGNNDQDIASQIDFDYLDKAYSEQVLSGILANLSYKLSDNHSISFKNLYSISSDDRVIIRTGETNPLESNPTLLRSTARWFTNNKIYSGQLAGAHYLPKSKIRISWTGSLSNIQREIPNLRRSIYTRFKTFNDPADPYLPDTVYSANISYANVGPDYGGGMFFSENRESIYSFKVDASYSFHAGAKSTNELKLGGLIQSRSRSFFARQLGYTRYGKLGGNVTFNDSLLYLDENAIFSAENMGLISPPESGTNGVGGFKLTDGTKYTDAYTASSTLQAAYLMLDNKYSFARLIWGLRLENFHQKLNAMKSKTVEEKLDTAILDVLPSANLILAVSEKQNIRICYSQTLNRPEYRELAPFAFYDFNTQFVISGCDTLKRAKIHNMDLRYEFYPGRGQLVSASLFYKKFIDPIEQISRPDVTNEISFRNVPGATNYGVELEFRCVPGALFNADSSRILNNITVFSNLAIIRSMVDVKEVIGASASTRMLQGQSPYVLNAGIQYVDPKLNISFSASFNKIGPRIAIAGNINEPDIWENSRAFLDLQVTKSFRRNTIELKFNAQNLFAQQQVFYQNRDLEESSRKGTRTFFNSIATGDPKNENGYSSREDDLVWATKFGKVFSAGISIRF
jgi:hypothetical protein